MVRYFCPDTIYILIKIQMKRFKTILYILSCSEKENALIELIIKYNLNLEHVCNAVEILERKKIIKIIK